MKKKKTTKNQNEAMEAQQKKEEPQNRKPTRRNRPVIRQTLTSMYRMAKANPLLWLGDGKKDAELQKLKLPKSVTSFSYLNNTQLEVNGVLVGDAKPLPGRTTTVSTCQDKKGNTHPDKKPNVGASAGGDMKLLPARTTVNADPNKKGNIDLDKRANAHPVRKHAEPARVNAKALGQSKESTKPPSTQTRKNFVLSNKQNAFIRGDKQRVSLTSQYRKRQQMKCDTNAAPQRRSRSAESFRPIQPESICESVQSVEDITKPTLFEKVEVRRVTFKSPVGRGYNRQSCAFTTPRNNHRVSFYSSTPRPTPNDADLKRKLDEWLRKRGKSFSSFHHLKCFNMGGSLDEENKENVEVPVDLNKDESYENLEIARDDQSTPVQDFRLLAKDALQDLLKLIQDGYSQDQCEAWLVKIRQKYYDLDEEPQYWECRAALEQSKGNITAAVECYRSAIVKGAEVQTVDESLEQLLQKFSLFNINMDEEKESEETKRKARIVLDARNAFKSTIIQFAVQEKKMRNRKDGDTEEQFVVVTPVRRSARLSTSIRPGGSALKLCSTLKELKGDDVHFKNNCYLSRRYAP